MMQRFFLAFCGALFVGSAGAFLLFVPLLSIATVVLIMVGLMLMFGLGFQAGAKRMSPSERIEKPVWAPHQDTATEF
jgi:hypothetical protein